MSWRPPVRTVLVSVLALGAAACAGVTPTSSQQNPDGGGVDKATMSTTGGPDAATVTDTRPNAPDLSIATDAGTCTPSVTCDPPNGRYCGTIGNGCFGMIDCGTCPGDQVCDDNVCVGGASCVALACQTTHRQLLRHRRQRLRQGDGLRRLRLQPGLRHGRLRSRRRLQAADVHDGHRPLLRHDRRRLRRDADVRRLSGGLDLRRRGRREHLRADQLHGRDLHGGGRRPLLRQHR